MARKYPKFSAQEQKRRAGELSKLMEEEALDAVVFAGGLGTSANIYYFTNYLARSQSFYVTTKGGDGEILVGHFNHIPTCKEMSHIQTVGWATHSPAEKIASDLKQLFGGAPIRKIGFIGNVPYSVVSKLEKEFAPTLEFTKRANAIRAVKSKEEIEWIQRGSRFTDKAVEALERELKPGMNEFDITNIVESAYLPLGGTTRIHYMGSTSMRRPDIYVPSQNQTARKVKKGDVVITEISAEYGGYSGQVHRPISIVEKPTKEYTRMYDVAKSAYEAILDVLKDGASSEELVKAVDGVIMQAGYTICDSVVHGYGTDLMQPDLGTSNGPYPNPHYVYKENMAIVIQPNPITKDEKYGLQLGNLCLVGKKKSASMQRYPLKFITVG